VQRLCHAMHQIHVSTMAYVVRTQQQVLRIAHVLMINTRAIIVKVRTHKSLLVIHNLISVFYLGAYSATRAGAMMQFVNTMWNVKLNSSVSITRDNVYRCQLYCQQYALCVVYSYNSMTGECMAAKNVDTVIGNGHSLYVIR
jgi:hypothetical protein